jgi:hypothetical protein
MDLIIKSVSYITEANTRARAHTHTHTHTDACNLSLQMTVCHRLADFEYST